MKCSNIILCLCTLLCITVPLRAQKTEVSVEKGTVRAETHTESVDIDAGRKVILRTDTDPLVTVNSPLVKDALELYTLAEKEKKNASRPIDSIFVGVVKLEAERTLAAIYGEYPNRTSQPAREIDLGYWPDLEDFSLYDLEGNLCPLQEAGRQGAVVNYKVQLTYDIAPDDSLKAIAVVNIEEFPLLPDNAPVFWKDGAVTLFRVGLVGTNRLTYYRFVLPESAVILDASHDIVAMDIVDGQPAITIKQYTGPYADATCIVAMLVPEAGESRLANIPDKYHGLCSQANLEQRALFLETLDKIQAGQAYDDQDTPLNALLTLYSIALLEDKDVYFKLAYNRIAPKAMDDALSRLTYWMQQLDLGRIPPHPQNPGNGYAHPAYLCRKGSVIEEIPQTFVYEDGLWYCHHGFTVQPTHPPLTAEERAAARARGYLCDWQVAGPYVQRDTDHDALLEIPLGPELSDVNVPWRPIAMVHYPGQPEHPAYLDLNATCHGLDQAVAYLKTEIVSESEKSARLELSTDDSHRVWLNGEQINPTEAFTLRAGNNTLLLKVADDAGPWGAVARLVTEED